MALTTIDLIAAGLQPQVPILKASATSEGAGTFHSLWKVAGNPGAGANPPAFGSGSGYQCTNATAGAIPYVNAASGETIEAALQAAGSTAGCLFLYDRLWTCSGFGTVVTSAQNVVTPGTIPARDANGLALGDGVEIWGEVYTAPGATGATWTVSYTDQAGNAGASATYAHPANAETAGQLFPFLFAAGDVGVRAVASLTCSVSSGTAGDIGITLMRRMGMIPFTAANVGGILDLIAGGSPPLYDGSCLALMMMCSATNTGLIIGQMSYSQG
jgi:hypothetical protein